jgi:hypothetical protein
MTATPSKQGLYPHEIMMLEYAPRFKTVNNTFQGFWYWQYSITEPQAVLDSLYKRGFIEISDLRTTLERLRIPEIKEELKLIQQKMTGKKAELIDRLIEFGDIEGLEKKYIERYYVITSKGEDELNENQYVSYLHRHRYMTCWEMNKRIAQTQAVISSERGIAKKIASFPKNNGRINANETGSIIPLKEETRLAHPRFKDAWR